MRTESIAVTRLTLGVLALIWLLPVQASGDDTQTWLQFDFRDGKRGWRAGFADFKEHDLALMMPVAELRELPPELMTEGTGFFLAGTNVSADLFMFLARKVGPGAGLIPHQAYQVEYTLTFASRAPTDCGGIGGSPGESVALKAGASSIEPEVVLDSNGAFRMNVDKGNQNNSGPAASVVGNIANGIPCEEARSLDFPFVSLVREHIHEYTVTSNSDGELWLLIGTDSGFEGRTELYYEQVDVLLTAIQSPDPECMSTWPVVTIETLGKNQRTHNAKVSHSITGNIVDPDSLGPTARRIRICKDTPVEISITDTTGKPRIRTKGPIECDAWGTCSVRWLGSKVTYKARSEDGKDRDQIKLIPFLL